MCGLAGIYNFRSLGPVNRSTVVCMARLLAHRGPDDEGTYFNGAYGVGHRRLSILDLSERGHQPMTTADGRFVIAYNGEIYNFVELRKQLEAHGVVFRTDTDTEVILALYACKGIECLQDLNGMFAFALWDRAERSLLLARDRLGVKPLYYAETSEGIVFASEIKALLLSPAVSPRVRQANIAAYLKSGYVAGAETLFEGILKVLPGNWLQVTEAGVKYGCYWDVEYAPNEGRSADQTADELRELLQDAMRINLRSDVPVGVFLSGGLDSSTTVALLAEAGIPDLKTFSVAYRAGPYYDETRYAELVARHFHTDHHVLYIDATDFLDCIPRYVWYMDEPVAEAPGLSFYLIAKLLREHVTVALSGEGADELFAGYVFYRNMRWLEAYRNLPGLLRAPVESVLGCIGTPAVQKYLRWAQLPFEVHYRGVFNGDPAQRESLYTTDFQAALARLPAADPVATYYEKTRGAGVLTKMLYADLKTWLVDDLLIKADRMTMANSVELRVPFLDYRVVQYAATIPSSMKLHQGKAKWILKRAMKGRLPRAILRRAKRGFPTPLAAMFRRDLLDYLRDVLLSSDSVNRGYFRREAVAALIDEHARSVSDHHRVLWQLLVLEEWHKRFIDHNPAYPEPSGSFISGRQL